MQGLQEFIRGSSTVRVTRTLLCWESVGDSIVWADQCLLLKRIFGLSQEGGYAAMTGHDCQLELAHGFGIGLARGKSGIP